MNRIHILTLFYGLLIFNGMVGMEPAVQSSEVGRVLSWKEEIDRKVDRCNLPELVEYKKNTLNEAESTWALYNNARKVELFFNAFISYIAFEKYNAFDLEAESNSSCSYYIENVVFPIMLGLGALLPGWIHIKNDSRLKKSCYALQVIENKEKLLASQQRDYESNTRKELDRVVQDISSISENCNFRSLIIKNQYEHNRKKLDSFSTLMPLPSLIAALWYVGGDFDPESMLFFSSVVGCGAELAGLALEYNVENYKYLSDTLRDNCKKLEDITT